MYEALVSRTKENIGPYDARARYFSDSHSLICPACGNAVRLRYGDIRTAYFAHRNGRADPDCENYRGGGIYVSKTFAKFSDSQPTALDAFGFQESGLYLCPREHGRFELLLKLASAPREQPWTGSINLTSLIGEVAVHWRELNRPQFVPIKPYEGRLSITCSGEIDEHYITGLEQSTPFLNPRLNVFRSSVTTGRLLPPNAPLHWGEKYWALLKRVVRHPRSEPYCLTIVEYPVDDDWIVLEFTLPEYWLELAQIQRDDIQDWLGRPILDPPLRVWLISPFPTRITDDGVYVVPRAYNVLKVFLSGNADLTAFGAGGSVAINKLSEHVFELNQISAGELTVYLNGYPALVISSEDEGFFRPLGIWLATDAESVELFQTAQVTRLIQTAIVDGTEFGLKLGHADLRQCLRLNDKPVSDVAALDHLENAKFARVEIDAGAFGQVNFSPTFPVAKATALSAATIARIQYLLNIASNAPDATVRWPCTTTSTAAPRLLGKLSRVRWQVRFQPYVRALEVQLRREGVI